MTMRCRSKHLCPLTPGQRPVMLSSRRPLASCLHVWQGRNSPRLFHRWVSLPARCLADSHGPVTGGGLGG